MSGPLVTLVGGEGALELSDRIAAALTPADGVHLVELRRAADPGIPADEIAIRLETALRVRSASGAPIPHVIVAVEDGESVMPVTAALVLLDARRAAALDCVVMAVHGPAATVRIASGDGVVPASMAAGLAIADRTVLGGAGDLTGPAFVEVATALRRANRLGAIVAPAIGGLPVGGLFSTGCWTGELRVGPAAPGDVGAPGHGVGPALDSSCSPFEAMSFELPVPVGAGAVRSVVERLVSREPDVLRVQALVRVQHGMTACVHAVGSRSIPSGRVAMSCRLSAADGDVTYAGGPAGTVTVVAAAPLRPSIERLLATELMAGGAGMDARP
jgi:hypothetical protein